MRALEVGSPAGKHIYLREGLAPQRVSVIRPPSPNAKPVNCDARDRHVRDHGSQSRPLPRIMGYDQRVLLCIAFKRTTPLTDGRFAGAPCFVALHMQICSPQERKGGARGGAAEKIAENMFTFSRRASLDVPQH